MEKLEYGKYLKNQAKQDNMAMYGNMKQDVWKICGIKMLQLNNQKIFWIIVIQWL